MQTRLPIFFVVNCLAFFWISELHAQNEVKYVDVHLHFSNQVNKPQGRRRPLRPGAASTPDGITNRLLRRSPKHVDPGDVDDALEGQPPSRGQDRPAQPDRSMLSQLLERAGAATLLDRPRHTLWQ